MKRSLLFILVFAIITKTVSAQDLPNPPANLKILPTGSYIIPMDNTYQLNSASLFNLKAYGLVVYLLKNAVKIKWVINSGKLKDGIDFTTTVQQVKPSLIVGAASANFKGGPFVIYATDLVGVDALIDAYYTSNSLSGTDRPNVYRTIGPVTVDVRYDLTGFLPRGAILTDGGNQAIHMAYMSAAGIPSSTYMLSTGANLTAGCFTFVSEPHNDVTGSTVDTAITRIRNFVLLGGNFLAQCAAVNNYENNPLGRFQTTTGITVNNTNIGTTGSYANPDLSYSQFEGLYDGNQAGVTKNWTINGSGINNEHNHYTGTGAISSSIGASVSKLKTGLGGLVFYLGCHSFTTSDQQNINGIRMYMNAFLTPALVVCGTYILPLKLLKFSAIVVNHQPQLQWSVSENEMGNDFEIERSYNGTDFSRIGSVANNGRTGTESYSYQDPKALNPVTYFRVKIVSKNGNTSYSNIITVKPDENKQGNNLVVLQNPFISAISFSYYSIRPEIKDVTLYNTTGEKVYSKKMSFNEGPNTYSFTPERKMTTGMYFLVLGNASESVITKVLKQ